jgi:hypothetical protein
MNGLGAHSSVLQLVKDRRLRSTRSRNSLEWLRKRFAEVPLTVRARQSGSPVVIEVSRALRDVLRHQFREKLDEFLDEEVAEHRNSAAFGAVVYRLPLNRRDYVLN